MTTGATDTAITPMAIDRRNTPAETQQKTLFLLQVANASFPTGAFHPSYGFETLISRGVVHDAISFETACRDWLVYTLARSEGIAVALACDAVRFGDPDRLVVLDRRLASLKLSREEREASWMMGQSLLSAYRDVFDRPGLDEFSAMLREGRVEGHQAVVFGAVCGAFDIATSDAVLAFLQNAVANLAGVACRLVPLGQVETQRVIAALWPVIQTFSRDAPDLDLEDMNTAMLSLDMASMQHEKQRTRLCMS
ncbi:MAG: urease accessory protein UreF [Qingshengfaniella sp.]